ncbi:helix-turn-helix transcriptional regulator [Photorhabdus laumondii]|uniref:Putative transcriptional regulator n=1 Tax=Photorhabdus aegyptia TaxID=2805098 RepID=A0A022PH10_9GAMM|nr:XRE family transcriptional regulator [Photorhabdus laumondii subsp. laumondii]EYU14834.1 putative transcriptional regulator [Photorhabdus aegyptia]MCC8387408.1 helix-turn-helix transcriptional regulator [Photorhabdus laumondii]RAW86792.1 XRE family transcriptional regulator [Photorhabdus sp. S5P8-50]RAW86968.1 XRE family transcriptional regulator [Photorhabdus sp. S12-55]
MSSIYSEEYQHVIRLLRETLLEKGITQEKLAQAFGRPQSFIAKVENGERRDYTLWILRCIAAARE